MKLKLVQYPNPILAQKSKKVTLIDDSIKKLAADMAETMRGYDSTQEAGVAIAAVQVGVPIRLTVIRDDEEESGYYVLINPEVVKGKDEEKDFEGCMSVPKKYGEVTRYHKVKVKAMDLNGRKVEVKGEGLMARVLQHEIDHMNGLLFLDHVDPNEIYRLNEEGKLVK